MNQNFINAILLLIIAIILSFFFYPVSEKQANRSLNAMGFTDIKIKGYNFFSCGEHDWYHTGFEAKNINGKKVTGTVCSGLIFKNSTVRFD